ncbi:hypothetical protein EV217_5089 [Phyllobacterium myrsinacearum]|nr:hypothetical protein EV217_5089 [Phyllobacterium myrsinacearum]
MQCCCCEKTLGTEHRPSAEDERIGTECIPYAKEYIDIQLNRTSAMIAELEAEIPALDLSELAPNLGSLKTKIDEAQASPEQNQWVEALEYIEKIEPLAAIKAILDTLADTSTGDALEKMNTIVERLFPTVGDTTVENLDGEMK